MKVFMRKRIGLIKSVIKINGIKRREFLIIVKGRMGGILNLQKSGRGSFAGTEFYEIFVITQNHAYTKSDDDTHGKPSILYAPISLK
jgi:hypothetical protein